MGHGVGLVLWVEHVVEVAEGGDIVVDVGMVGAVDGAVRNVDVLGAAVGVLGIFVGTDVTVVDDVGSTSGMLVRPRLLMW